MTDIVIITEIETFLRYGMVFDYVLKKNPRIYSHILQSINYTDYWFEYNGDGISFIGKPMLDEITNYRGDFFYRYISDFVFKGNLCYTDNKNAEKRIDVTINATIRIFKQPSFEIDITEKSNNVEVWDVNQKLTNLINFQSSKKLEGFNMIPYNYGMYTKTWSKMDKTSDNYKKQTHVTSRYYMQEIIECNERIKHLLSLVLLNEPYSNNYTSRKTTLPANYNADFLIEIDENFKIYDRFFLLYSELTIESLYKFWERVGFYLFQFFKPSSNKVNDKNLSFYKLISELSKESPSNPYLQNYHFDWFVDFVLKSDSDFEKLINYRHPLIHYKIDNSTGFETGI